MNLNDVIKWIATVFTVIGALAVANGWDPLNIWMFNIGSVLWTWWAIRIKEKSILVVNVAMLSIYVYGLLVRMS